MRTESKRLRSIVIIAYHYPPDRAVGGVRPSHFAKYLAREGYRVSIVTASEQPEDGPQTVFYIPAPKSGRTSLTGIGEAVLRKTAFPHDEGMLWSVKAFRIAERIVVADQNSCIISTFPPVNTHLIALALKRRYPSVQWVADFRDPLANSPSRLASPQDRQFPRLCSFAEQKLQARIFAAADTVVANSDRVADIWKSQVPQYAHKIEHIWNGFDSEEDLGPKPIPPRPFQVIAHVGGIFGYRNPGMLLESLERLIDAGRVDPATVRVRQVGSVSGPKLLGRFSRLREIGCLEELGRVPKPQAEAELQTADKLLLLDVDHPDAGQQVPSKVFEYLRIGRPVLAFTPKQSPTERIVLGSGIPSFAISSDMPAAEVDWRVVEFLSWPADPVAPSGWFLQEFDASARVRKLISLLES